MKTKKSILALIILIIFSLIVVSAQDLRIRFPKGRTSATMSGKISNGGRVCYLANARAGQTFTATLSSRSGKVQIFESGESSYNYVIEQSGDQSVCADNLSSSTTYTLTVSVR